MRNYRIYQLKDEARREYGFEPYRRVINRVSRANYSEMYAGALTDCENPLEELFLMFNVNRPADFKGWSLSVSDVIVLEESAYYVDSYGFVELENWGK